MFFEKFNISYKPTPHRSRSDRSSTAAAPNVHLLLVSAFCFENVSRVRRAASTRKFDVSRTFTIMPDDAGAQAAGADNVHACLLYTSDAADE